MTTVTIPGTFDPITLGHISIVRRAANAFDRVIVGVAAGIHKKTLFTLDERLEMARQSFPDEGDRVSVAPVTGLLVDFLRANDCKVVIRGLRAISDFELETQLAFVNKRLYPDLETMLMMPDLEYTHVYSNLVREIAVLDGDVSHFVPPHVCEALERKVRSNAKGDG